MEGWTYRRRLLISHYSRYRVGRGRYGLLEEQRRRTSDRPLPTARHMTDTQAQLTYPLVLRKLNRLGEKTHRLEGFWLVYRAARD